MSGDAFEAMLADIVKAIKAHRTEIEQSLPVADSPTLSVAMAAGFEPKMSYSIAQCSKITGLPVDKLKNDHRRGALDFIEPDGERGYRISIYELDRYLKTLGVIL